MPGTVSAQLAIAQPRRIKATHRRRRKVTAGHFVQRYYDPQVGRFLSNDPISVDTDAGGSFNRYNYANNNPSRFTDPDGRAAASSKPLHEAGLDAEARVRKALLSDGVEFLEKVKITTVLDDGTRFAAVADFAYVKDGRMTFLEVKDGMGSKLSTNQK